MENPEGYISQTMKLGALGIPAYHTFSLEELEEATNNFDTSAFMGEGSQGQVYQSGVNIYLFFFFLAYATVQSPSRMSILSFFPYSQLI